MNVLKKEHIDIIHTYHNGGHKLGFWLTLLNLKKNKLFINRGVLSKPNNLFYYINPIIDSFTCNSLGCVNVLKSRFIKSSKINLIYNHIRTKNISNKIKKDALYLCYIGNENPIKGFDIFNDIFTELRKTIEIKAYAVGIDANKVKINVHNDIELVGETKDVYQYLLKSDISVLTSRSESFPNVILEAMNAGLPIVASKVGAVPEIIINDKMGYICNSKEEFIEKIVHLSKNKELRDKMGTLNSEILSKNFDIHTKAEKLLRVYCGENYIDKISEL
ncbi:MAG: glycosyl transferase [Deferribacteraceae bacterium]|nr:glycosyl transferase [Deferribacteraceae bacterium]